MNKYEAYENDRFVNDLLSAFRCELSELLPQADDEAESLAAELNSESSDVPAHLLDSQKVLREVLARMQSNETARMWELIAPLTFCLVITNSIQKRAKARMSGDAEDKEATIYLPPEIAEACSWVESLQIKVSGARPTIVHVQGVNIPENNNRIGVWIADNAEEVNVLSNEVRVAFLPVCVGEPKLVIKLLNTGQAL